MPLAPAKVRCQRRLPAPRSFCAVAFRRGLHPTDYPVNPAGLRPNAMQRSSNSKTQKPPCGLESLLAIRNRNAAFKSLRPPDCSLRFLLISVAEIGSNRRSRLLRLRRRANRHFVHRKRIILVRLLLCRLRLRNRFRLRSRLAALDRVYGHDSPHLFHRPIREFLYPPPH